jgi:hypothetical protein
MGGQRGHFFCKGDVFVPPFKDRARVRRFSAWSVIVLLEDSEEKQKVRVR